MLQQSGDLAQHIVSSRMTVGIVDLLKMVDIKNYQPQ
ncbi:Uncharacterised protein [Vibrio cholerae]|nr:Uncharacterised protein [Vibrio cholerae]